MKMSRFIKTKLKNVNEINILPYHRTGSSKYDKFKIKNRLPDMEPPSEKEIKRVENYLKQEGFSVKIGG